MRGRHQIARIGYSIMRNPLNLKMPVELTVWDSDTGERLKFARYVDRDRANAGMMAIAKQRVDRRPAAPSGEWWRS